MLIKPETTSASTGKRASSLSKLGELTQVFSKTLDSLFGESSREKAEHHTRAGNFPLDHYSSLVGKEIRLYIPSDNDRIALLKSYRKIRAQIKRQKAFNEGLALGMSGNHAAVATFVAYRVGYSYNTKSPFVIMEFSDVILNKETHRPPVLATSPKEKKRWSNILRHDPDDYCYLNEVDTTLTDGEPPSLKKAYAIYRYTFDNVGMLKPGDIVYLEVATVPVQSFREEKHGIRICEIENVCILNRVSTRIKRIKVPVKRDTFTAFTTFESTHPFPENCQTFQKNKSTYSQPNLIEYLSSLHPTILEEAQEEWGELVSSVRHRFTVGTRLYRLINPLNSASLRYEAHAAFLQIQKLEMRAFKACYIVSDADTEEKILVAQRLINPARNKRGYPLFNTYFFTTLEKAQERAHELNKKLEENPVLWEVL